MKKVLIIAYYFPPMGMAGVQRAAKFAKYLPRFSWRPIIVTVKDIIYYARDESLLDELKDVVVYRTGSLDPLRLFCKLKWVVHKAENSDRKKVRKSYFTQLLLEKLNNFLNNWICVPDTKILWFPFALLKAVEIVKGTKIDLIMTTSPPHSSHLLGLLLKKFLRIRWIADFRDNWTGSEIDKSPTPIHRKLHRVLERLVLQNSDRVIAISDFISKDLRAKSGGGNTKFITLTNGYDPQDFESTGKITKNEKKFTITHCGTLSPISDPGNFLVALKELMNEKKELKNSIRVLFVGTHYGIDLKPMLRGLEDVVVPVGYVSHRESIRYLLSSNLLLLLRSEGCSHGMVTSKIFEYLASQKPILAIVPECEAAKIIKSSGRGTVVKPGDISGIKKEIELCFSKWQRNREYEESVFVSRKAQTEGLQTKVDIYSRIELTERLAKVFNQLEGHQ